MSSLSAAAALSLVLATQAGSPDPAQHDTPELTREQEADQKAAVSGEAPAPEHRREQPLEDAIQAPGEPPAGAPLRQGARRDALEHLGRIETIVSRLLDDETSAQEPVTTRGTPVAEDSGERVPVPRARLEELRTHIEQLRTALETAEARR